MNGKFILLSYCQQVFYVFARQSVKRIINKKTTTIKILGLNPENSMSLEDLLVFFYLFFVNFYLKLRKVNCFKNRVNLTENDQLLHKLTRRPIVLFSREFRHKRIWLNCERNEREVHFNSSINSELNCVEKIKREFQ
jgi:hypothetical protein